VTTADVTGGDAAGVVTTTGLAAATVRLFSGECLVISSKEFHSL
jgi:hypothetical protein